MFALMLLEQLVKLTPPEEDDKLVADLQLFFQQHPMLRANLFSVIWRGVQNGFDFNDEKFSEDLLAVVFDILRTRAE